MNATPFFDTLAIRPLGNGTFAADLHPDWAVGERPHGGYLLALLSRAAVGGGSLQPLSVSAQYLRPPKVGPVLLRTERLKAGRTVTAVRSVLEQSGQTCVDAMITLGELPDEEPAYSDLPEMPVNPPQDAVDLANPDTRAAPGLTRTCDMRIDPRSAGFLRGSTSDPLRLRLWVRPHAGQPDVLFGLVAGDLTMPVTFNLGRFGWSPTVQLTALLRARPANGWLRLVVESKAVHGAWFDEDTLVIDSTGKLVCQARQLALSPLRAPD